MWHMIWSQIYRSNNFPFITCCWHLNNKINIMTHCFFFNFNEIMNKIGWRKNVHRFVLPDTLGTLRFQKGTTLPHTCMYKSFLYLLLVKCTNFAPIWLFPISTSISEYVVLFFKLSSHLKLSIYFMAWKITQYDRTLNAEQ